MPYIRVKGVIALPTSQRVTTAVKRMSVTPMMSTTSAIETSRMATAHRPEVRSSLWIRHRLEREDRPCRPMSLLGVRYNEIRMGPLWSQGS